MCTCVVCVFVTVIVCVRVCAILYVSVCVREGDREREGDKNRLFVCNCECVLIYVRACCERDIVVCPGGCHIGCMCVYVLCVCVCARARAYVLRDAASLKGRQSAPSAGPIPYC